MSFAVEIKFDIRSFIGPSSAPRKADSNLVTVKMVSLYKNHTLHTYFDAYLSWSACCNPVPKPIAEKVGWVSASYSSISLNYSVILKNMTNVSVHIVASFLVQSMNFVMPHRIRRIRIAETRGKHSRAPVKDVIGRKVLKLTTILQHSTQVMYQCQSLDLE